MSATLVESGIAPVTVEVASSTPVVVDLSVADVAVEIAPQGAAGPAGAAGAAGTAGPAGANGAGYGGATVSALTIAGGPVTFTTQAGLAWQAGNGIRLSNGASWMEGQITAYTGTAMTVNVTLSSGSGSASSWTLGPPGGVPGAGAVSSVNGAVGAVVIAVPNASDVMQVDGSDLAAIVDANDNVLLYFKVDGTSVFPGLQALGTGTFDAIATADTVTEQVWGLAYAIVGSNGRVAFYVLDDGTVGTPGVALLPSGYASSAIVATDTPINQAADYNVLLGSGQSLASSGCSGSIIYAAADFDDHDGAGAVSPLNNTGLYGTAMVATEQAKFMMAGDAGRSILPSPGYANDYAQIVSSNAYPGVTIAQMQPGASPDRFAAHMTALGVAVTYATAANKTAQVPFVTWQQGESDTATATYKADLKTLKNNYNTQALALTKQPNRFPMIYTQLAGSNSGGIPVVGKAQWEAWQEDAECVLACPQYQFPYVDAVHLSDLGYQALGQMLGKVCYLAGYMGKAWKPLYPLSAKVRAGNVLTVKFSVPRPPIVIDTTTLLAATNYGFRVFDATGELTVSNVAVVNQDTVRMQLNRALGSSPVVEYAWRDDPVNGGNGNFNGLGTHAVRGNIRDSDASVGVYTPAVPLWNWLVRFSLAITP